MCLCLRMVLRFRLLSWLSLPSKLSQQPPTHARSQDRSECWGALLEELRNHVADSPDPNAAVRVLPHWAEITRALLYGAPMATAPAANRRGSGGGAGAGVHHPQYLHHQHQHRGNGGGAAAAAPPPSQAALALVAATTGADGASWLGDDEASQMQVRKTWSRGWDSGFLSG